jgi:heptosyltransferase-1
MDAFRILVVRLGAMGDVIHALPAVATLKHSFPRSHVTWVIRPRWMPLIEGNPFVDEVVPLEKSFSSARAALRRLRGERFDLAVDLQGLIQSAVVTAAVKADRVIGLHRAQVSERIASLFYSNEVTTRTAHVVDQNLELVAAAGASNPLRAFPLPEGSPEGDLPEGRFVLTSPLAGWGSKQWPLEYYGELAHLLDMPLVVNGPPDAADILNRVDGARVHLSGIRGLIHATRRAHSVVGVDSGPMHIAAALMKPGVAIFGPTDPARNGPYGGSLRVLRTEDASTTYKRTTNDRDMRRVSPAAVAEALAALSNSAGCPA